MNLDELVFVPLPADLYQAVARRFPDRVATVIANVTTDFLDRTKGDLIGGERYEPGLFWEKLFLPVGTLLRTNYFGQYKEGKVEALQPSGAGLVYLGKSFPSVSRMASAMRNDTSVNAWKHIEIKRPGDATWQLALKLRPAYS